MFRHFIIISNDYLRRTRIALDIVDEDDGYIDHIGKTLKKYGHLNARDLVDIVHRANSYKRCENLTKI